MKRRSGASVPDIEPNAKRATINIGGEEIEIDTGWSYMSHHLNPLSLKR